MKASENRIGGYAMTKKRSVRTPAHKLRQAAIKRAEVAEAREALEAMFSSIYELLAAQKRAYTGEIGMDGHAAAMRKLLRYIKRKMKQTAENTGAKPPLGCKAVRSQAKFAVASRKGCMRNQ